jgi:hypothetical protein
MSVYEEGNVYKGSITDQTVCTRERDGEVEVQIPFTVRITARLKDENNPGDGSEECPQHERQVLITIVENDADRLRMALRDLERLGFADDDISRLHPEHPQFVSLVGREVHVRLKVVDDREYWNFAWPREKPKPASLGTLQAIAGGLKDKIVDARKRSKGGGKTSKANAGPPTAPARETPLPDVGY